MKSHLLLTPETGNSPPTANSVSCVIRQTWSCRLHKSSRKNWCSLSRLAPVTNNKRLYEQADPWRGSNTWGLSNNARQSPCTVLPGLGFFFSLLSSLETYSEPSELFPQVQDAKGICFHHVIAVGPSLLLLRLAFNESQSQSFAESCLSDPRPVRNSRGQWQEPWLGVGQLGRPEVQFRRCLQPATGAGASL